MNIHCCADVGAEDASVVAHHATKEYAFAEEFKTLILKIKPIEK